MFRRRTPGRDLWISQDFDEAGYLAANPDVAAAVRSGSYPSGYQHWIVAGRGEGRPLSPSHSRNSIVCRELDLVGRGLELGPLDKPIVPKRDGHRVEVVDYIDTAGLRERYGAQEHVGVDPTLIEEVDHVSHGESLTELIGEEGVFDYVVASHVVEHIPDLVSFFQDVERILAPTGRLGLVVPDKRFCFDHYGELTSTGQLLDAFAEKRTRPTSGQVFDYFARTAQVNGAIAWGQVEGVVPDLRYDFEAGDEGRERSLNGDDFGGEIHCWRFTPQSFRLIVAELNALGLTSLGIVAEHDTVGIEFFVTLGVASKSIPDRDARLEMLRAVQASDPLKRT